MIVALHKIIIFFVIYQKSNDKHTAIQICITDEVMWSFEFVHENFISSINSYSF